jgi:hypothetical protein
LQGFKVLSEGALVAGSGSLIAGLPGSATCSRVVCFLFVSLVFLWVTCPGCFQLLAACALYVVLVLHFFLFLSWFESALADFVL